MFLNLQIEPGLIILDLWLSQETNYENFSDIIGITGYALAKNENLMDISIAGAAQVAQPARPCQVR